MTALSDAKTSPGTEDSTVVYSVDTLHDAAFMIERLVSGGLSRESLSVRGEGLSMRPARTRQPSRWSATSKDALSGLATGVIVALLFAMIGWLDPLSSAARVTVLAGLLGAVVSAVFGEVQRGFSVVDRDAVDVSGVHAERLDIVAAGPIELAQAREVIHHLDAV